MLAAKGVKRSAIAKVLNLPSPRVTEMYKGERRLQLDEAKKLVEAFDIDESSISPLSVPVARLLAIYAARSLGVNVSPEDERIEELAQEFRAFSEFAADPEARESEQQVQAFFQGLRLAPNRATAS